MTFTMTLECDNAAFDQDPQIEIARILAKLADQIHRGPDMIGAEAGGRLLDINGNHVGDWEVTP